MYKIEASQGLGSFFGNIYKSKTEYEMKQSFAMEYDTDVHAAYCLLAEEDRVSLVLW